MKYALAAFSGMVLCSVAVLLYSERVELPDACRPHGGGILALTAPDRSDECSNARKEVCINLRDEPWLAPMMDLDGRIDGRCVKV